MTEIEGKKKREKKGERERARGRSRGRSRSSSWKGATGVDPSSSVDGSRREEGG